MRLWPWVTGAAGVLVAAGAAAGSTGSAMVALGGVFVAAQLVVPVAVDHRRLAAARRAPTARRVVNERFTGRRGTGAVGWIRVDVNSGQRQAVEV